MNTLFLGFVYMVTAYSVVGFARWAILTPGWIQSELTRVDREYLEQVAKNAQEYFVLWHERWLFEQHAKLTPTLHSPFELWCRPELVASPKRGALFYHNITQPGPEKAAGWEQMGKV